MSEEKERGSDLKKAVVLVIMVLLVGCVIGYFYWKRGKVTTDDAYVSNDIFPITPRIMGYVTEVYVSSNQKVNVWRLMPKTRATPRILLRSL